MDSLQQICTSQNSKNKSHDAALPTIPNSFLMLLLTWLRMGLIRSSLQPNKGVRAMISISFVSILWLSGAAALIYMGWDYWDANAAVLAAAALAGLAWFHVRSAGGSVLSLGRIMAADLLPMTAAAEVFARCSALPRAINLPGFVLAGVALLIAGILVRHIWERSPSSHTRLRLCATACFLSLVLYPVWRLASGGSFWLPALLVAAMIVFTGFAFRTGWDAAARAPSGGA
jgi:hypothetical protein